MESGGAEWAAGRWHLQNTERIDYDKNRFYNLLNELFFQSIVVREPYMAPISIRFREARLGVKGLCPQ